MGEPARKWEQEAADSDTMSNIAMPPKKLVAVASARENSPGSRGKTAIFLSAVVLLCAALLWFSESHTSVSTSAKNAFADVIHESIEHFPSRSLAGAYEDRSLPRAFSARERAILGIR